jgi:hypothetical protein
MKLTIEKRRKIAFIVLLMITIVAALCFLVIQPLKQQTNAVRDQSAALELKLSDLSKTRLDLLNHIETARQYRAHITKLESQMPSESIDTWTIGKVVQISDRNALTLNSSSVLTAPELSSLLLPDSSYEVYYFICNFNDTFFKLGHFLMELENRFPIAVVDQLVITSGTGIKYNCELTFYVRKKTRRLRPLSTLNPFLSFKI